MGAVVELRQGDGQHLPYRDASFDGGYAQHVTMNVPDRPRTTRWSRQRRALILYRAPGDSVSMCANDPF